MQEGAVDVISQHLPLLLVLLMSVGLGGIILALASFLGPYRPTAIKSEVFECGSESSGDARGRFNVRFYLVAILFLVFDIEAVFVYPWAVTFSAALRGENGLSPLLLLAEILVFFAIVLVGLAYVWKRGALDWEPSLQKARRRLGLQITEASH